MYNTKRKVHRRRNTLKNKIYSVALVGIGALTVPMENDATFLAFMLMIGLPLFFSKENWIY